MRNFFLLYFVCSIFVIFSMCFIPTAVSAQEKEVKIALLDFHNKFLPGVDSYQTIIYPKSDDYYDKWVSLVIAVGGDASIILTGGQSATAVKFVDVTSGIVKAARGKPGEAAVEYAVSEAADSGFKVIARNVPYFPKKSFGIRSAIAVYAVVKAGEEDKQRVFESISKQKEIQQFVGEVAPAVIEIQKRINSIESPGKKKEYQEMLSAMLLRRAQLTVFRQMQHDRKRAIINTLELAILKQVYPTLGKQLADGKLSPNRQLFDAASEYIAGKISKNQLIEQIKSYILNNSKAPSTYTKGMMDKHLNGIKGKLDEIDKARVEINKYGGSTLGKDTKPPTSYEQLNRIIPKTYRIAANINVRSLSIPASFKSSAPYKGTRVPEKAKAHLPKYLRKDVTSRPVMTSTYKPTTRQSASATVKKYGSVPGGVVLEGEGRGIDGIKSAIFNKSNGSIVLNGSIKYELPVTPQEMKDIFLAIAQDGNIGVSLVSGFTTYGALPKEGNVSLMLRQTDWFLAHLAYGWKGHYRDYLIAGGTTLRERDDTSGNVMCFFRFCDYKFAIVGSRCELKSSTFIATLIPIKVGVRAEDGGGLPDFDAIDKGNYPKNLLHNIKHIAENIDYYMRERMMRMVKCYGEAAAFARALKRNGIDLKKLAASM